MRRLRGGTSNKYNETGTPFYGLLDILLPVVAGYKLAHVIPYPIAPGLDEFDFRSDSIEVIARVANENERFAESKHIQFRIVRLRRYNKNAPMTLATAISIVTATKPREMKAMSHIKAVVALVSQSLD